LDHKYGVGLGFPWSTAMLARHGSRIEMYGIYKDRFGFDVRVCEGATSSLHFVSLLASGRSVGDM